MYWHDNKLMLKLALETNRWQVKTYLHTHIIVVKEGQKMHAKYIMIDFLPSLFWNCPCQTIGQIFHQECMQFKLANTFGKLKALLILVHVSKSICVGCFKYWVSKISLYPLLYFTHLNIFINCIMRDLIG
jgi:hypothetical protein